jgi:hypothetical protein
MAQMVKSVKNLKHGEEVEGQWGQEERSERKDRLGTWKGDGPDHLEVSFCKDHFIIKS